MAGYESLLLKRLDQIANFKYGEPPPDWMPDNNWGQPLSELCKEAAAEIRFLRSVAGVVSK